jgi:membrane protease YdiL (CAAX protease family)
MNASAAAVAAVPTQAVDTPGSGRRAAWLLAGLAAATFARAAVNGHSTTTALAAGSGFGIALLVTAILVGWRPSWPRGRSIVIGAVGGVVLIALPLFLHPAAASAIGMRPGPLAAWAAVTILVATSEEVLLRGPLFDAIGQRYGLSGAVVVSSLAFALVHVPLYGWAVVPLDIAAGVWLCGLRLASGGVAAPAIAHALADLATWWL